MIRLAAWLFSLLFFAASLAQGQGLCNRVHLNESEGFIPYASFSKKPLSPHEFVDARVNDFLKKIEKRDATLPDELGGPRKVQIRAKRNDLTKLIYAEGLVEASDFIYALQDKLLIAKLLENFMGVEKAAEFHPKTLGVKEFLSRHGYFMRDGRVLATREELLEVLKAEFPRGFIVKPSVGFASDGKTFFKDANEIVDLLVKPEGSEIYNPSESRNAFASNLQRGAVTGERFIFQALLKGLDANSGKLPVGSMNEFRVHTFYDQVVEGATLNRWRTFASQAMVKKANEFSQKFLKALPLKFVNRQAWAFDIFVAPNGEMTLIEINTNRGLQTNWSGFLKNPKVLGGYIRHLENHFGWKFEGFSGWRLRNNLANISGAALGLAEKYWNKTISRTVENIWGKASGLFEAARLNLKAFFEVADED